MGINNRDYIRDSPAEQPYRTAAHEGSTVNRIIIATVIIFLLQAVVPGVTESLMMTAEAFRSGQVWRFLTYAFCHSKHDPLHIIFNMLIFWWLGRELERMYGSREFLLFYLTAAVFSGLAYFALRIWLGNINPMLGASGAVIAVEMLYAVHYPRVKIWIWGIFPIEMRWLIVGLIVMDLYPVLQSLNGHGSASGVAHSAHLGGLLFGFLYWKFRIRIDPWVQKINPFSQHGRLRTRLKSSHLKIHRPQKKDDLDERVDLILEKISQQGEESLTEQERAVMAEASHRYKNR